MKSEWVIGARKLIRKAALVSLVLISILVLGTCSLFSKASVRFQNDTSDIIVNYGIGLGDARYVGSFPPGTITNYYKTSGGQYLVQIKNFDGSWVNDSLGSFTVEDGNGYSVVMSGSFGWRI